MRSFYPTIAALFFALGLLAPSTAPAQEPAEQERRYSRFYNGAFVDVAARGALIHVTSAEYSGWSWDVGLRHALVMHLLDTRLSYTEDRFSPRGDAATGKFTGRSVMVHGAFHPLYMALLFSDWIGYLLASFYLEAGMGGQHVTLETGDEADLGLKLSLGAGFDVPLSDPDRGWSIWANFVYRYNWGAFDFDSGGKLNLHHHAGWAGLSLRFNGLLF